MTLYCKRNAGWLHECAVCVGVGVASRVVPCVLGLPLATGNLPLACVQAQNLIFKEMLNTIAVTL